MHGGVCGGGPAMGFGVHGGTTLTSDYPHVGYLAPPSIRSPSIAVGAGFFRVPIQSLEVFGVGLFWKVKEEIERMENVCSVSPTPLGTLEFKAHCPRAR